MSRQTNLFRRQAVWYWRKAIPLDLQPVVGRKEFRISLKTYILHEARSRVGLFNARFEIFIRGIQELMEKADFSDSAVSAKLMRKFVDWYLNSLEYFKVLEGERSLADARAEARELLQASEEWKESIACNDFLHITTLLAPFMEQQELDYEEDDPEFKLFCRNTMRALVGVEKIAAKRELGDYEDDLPTILTAPWQEAVVPPEQPKLARRNQQQRAKASLLTLPLSQVFDKYIDEAKANLGYDSVRDLINAKKLFVALIGDLPFGDVLRDDATEFRKEVARIPKLHGKSIYTSLTPREAIKKADKIDDDLRASLEKRVTADKMSKAKMKETFERGKVKRVSYRTINKHLDSCGKLYKWAVDIHKLDVFNPFFKTRFGKNVMKDASQQRPHFEDKEIRSFFATPNWTGRKSRDIWIRPGAVIIKDAFYWIPLMSAHMGLRLEESAQLYVENIIELDGDVIGVEIKDGIGQTTKSQESNRFVPLHPLLKKLGFAVYVEKMKKDNKKRLFPELKPDGTRGRLGTSISKKLGHYRAALGIFEDGKANHSMRHSFDTMLINKDVLYIRVKELMGHAREDETGGRYYKGAKLQKLQEAIEKVNYGIKLEKKNGEWQISKDQ